MTNSLLRIGIVLVLTLIVVGLYLYQDMRINELINSQIALIDERDSLIEDNEYLTVSLGNLQEDYNEIDIKLNEPTYGEVIQILKELNGLKVDGNCCNYSEYVQGYFYNNGLQCYIVITNFKGGDGHVSVALNTKDKGWVYVEPIVLGEYNPVMGKPYLPLGLLSKGTVDDKVVTQLVVLR